MRKIHSFLIIIIFFIIIFHTKIHCQPLPPPPPPPPTGIDIQFADGSLSNDSIINTCSGQLLNFSVNGQVYGKTKNYALWYVFDDGPWFENSDDNCPGCSSGPNKNSFIFKGKTFQLTPDKNIIVMVLFAIDTNGQTIIGLCKWVKILMKFKPADAGNITGINQICKNDNNIEYSIQPVNLAKSYKWSLPFGATGSSDINSIIVNFTDKAKSGNIEVIPLNECGEAAKASLSIKVDSIPPKPAKPSGIKTMCINNVNTSYNISSIANATSYDWLLTPSQAGILNKAGVNLTIDWDNTFSGDVTLQAKASNFCGASDFSDTILIKIKNLPSAVDSISGEDNLCEGSQGIEFNATPAIGANSYIWSLPEGATGSSTSNKIIVNFAFNAKPGFITVKGLNSCGEGQKTSKNLNISYYPSKAEKPLGVTELCFNSSNTNYITNAALYAEDYLWQLNPPSAGNILVKGVNATIDWNNSFTGDAWLKVKARNACGDGAFSDSLKINIASLPQNAGTIFGQNSFCNNSGSATFYIKSVKFADSYTWDLQPLQSGQMQANDTSVTITWNDTYYGIANLKVKALNNCGESTFSNVFSIDILNKPFNFSDIISGIDILCEGSQNIIYSVPTVSNADKYIWELAPGLSGNSDTNNITVDFGNIFSDALIKVKAENICGFNDEIQKSIAIKPLPAKPSIPLGPKDLCFNPGKTDYYITTAANTLQYTWELSPSNAGTLNYDSLNASVDWNETYYGKAYLQVKGKNDCGDGLYSFKLEVNIRQQPPAAEIPQGLITVCQGSNNTYMTSDIFDAVSYEWILYPTSAGIIEGDTDTITVRWNENYTGSAYLKVKPISNCGEAPFSDSLAVTVNPMPQAATVISGESTVCEDSHNIIFSTNSLLNSDKFYWTLPDGAYGSSDSSSISVNFPLGAKNGNISVSGQNECGLGKNASLPIIVNPLPSTPLISPFISNICHYTQSSELLFIAENADSIFISFEPLDAGITQIKDSAINILWNKDFTGNAKIMLKAINECGETNFSDLAEFNINQPLQVDLGTDTTIMLNQSITLYAENNFKSFNWSNGSKVDSTIIVGKDLGWGTHKIYIEVTDSNNCYSSDTILISVDTSTTIFSKSLINPDITIFPNPASQFIYINSLKNLTNIDFAIINYNNKAIISKNIAFIQANSLYKIALPKLPPSLYFIKINNQYFKLNIY